MDENLKAVLDTVHFVTKPRKGDAKRILEQAIAGVDLTTEEWARLMRYFTPAPPKTPKTLRDWLAAATDEKDVRPFCHVIHRLADGRLVATDGKRLHIAPSDHPDAADIPEGDVISPVSWQAIHDRPEYAPPRRLDRFVDDHLNNAEPPVDLPPVNEWPETKYPDARFVPDSDVAVTVGHVQAAHVVHYLGVPVGETRSLGSALFSTPWGHAIIAPRRIK